MGVSCVCSLIDGFTMTVYAPVQEHWLGLASSHSWSKSTFCQDIKWCAATTLVA